MSAVNFIYQQRKNTTENNYPSSVVICCPKLSASSSHGKSYFFEQPIPILTNNITQIRKADTLPWTITSSDFAVLSLFPNGSISKDDVLCNHSNNSKVETVYICKPVSCKLYVAAAPSNSSVSRNVSKLGNISEQNDMTSCEQPVSVTSSNPAGHSIMSSQKLQDVGRLKHTIGFVIHADWSVCECFISENQVGINYGQISRLNDSKSIYI